MTRILASLAVSLLAVVAVPALAKGDLDAGKAKSQICQACHGTDGNAGVDPQYPRLAGQYRDYLMRALHEYRSGTRTNPIMAVWATQLNDQEIEDLAAYFSSLPGQLSTLHGHMQGQ